MGGAERGPQVSGGEGGIEGAERVLQVSGG